MTLRDRLEALIAAEGPIPVSTYMALCLHDPQAGYYATRPALGAEGDFITAPLVSQIFGELIGLWCAATWIALGRPPRVLWVELGPGDGTLIADARRAAARAVPAFVAAAEIVLVETSAPLRERQRAALGSAPPVWAERLQDVPTDAPMVLIANEFLDCLPVRQFVKTAKDWAERRVGRGENGGLAFGLAPAPAGFAPPAWAVGLQPGALIELSPAQASLGAELGRRVAAQGGAALMIDYGRAEPGPGDTLQALHRHAKVDPLAEPGAADLTVHADFPSVAAAARAAAAEATPILTQADFLQRLGIGERAEALARARPDRAEAIGRQLHRLLAPGEMGELFKAMAIHATGLAVPGFEETA